MNNKERAIMQQALEALKDAEKYGKVYFPGAITALREALASRCQTTTTEQAEQSQLADATLEPVAWIAVADEMPKPHKPVLVRYVITSPVYGGTRSKVIRAQWIPAKTEESNDDDHFEYDEETDTYYIPEGWYELVDNWDEYSSIHVCEGEITHWMRLPEFPNAAPVQQAEQEPFDMDDHPPHRLCECRKCMEYFTPLPDCDAFAASGKPIAEQTNTQFMEGYRIGLAEMREKCAKSVYDSTDWAHEERDMVLKEAIAAAIRAIKFEGDTGFRPVSEMIAEHKQDTKKAAAIEKAKMRKATRAEKIAMSGVYEVPVEQAEQEPVAYVYEKDVAGIGMRKDVAFTKHVEVGTDLYAAPIRTKDLTDENAIRASEREAIKMDILFALEKDTGAWSPDKAYNAGFNYALDLVEQEIDKRNQMVFNTPVRTKDLTDDDIVSLAKQTNGIYYDCDCVFARAVIAADREKNNANNNT